MKLFTLLLVYFLWALSAKASAETILLKEFPADNSGKVEVDFKINKELRSAWVNVAYGPYKKNHKIFLAGLWFDNHTSMITLHNQKCAKVETKGRSFFRYEKITPTGCKFEYEVDKAFPKKFVRVYLVTK